MEEDRFTRITLRIPKDVHASLQAAADEKAHSMNAEIVARLQESFDRPKLGFGPGSVGDELVRARQELEKAQQKLNDTAVNIADRMLDRMQERGLVLTKDVAETMIASSSPKKKSQ